MHSKRKFSMLNLAHTLCVISIKELTNFSMFLTKLQTHIRAKLSRHKRQSTWRVKDDMKRNCFFNENCDVINNKQWKVCKFHTRSVTKKTWVGETRTYTFIKPWKIDTFNRLHDRKGTKLVSNIPLSNSTIIHRNSNMTSNVK